MDRRQHRRQGHSDYRQMDIDENGPHRRAARGYRMQLQVGEGMPLGTVASRIAFETNHGEEIEPPLLEVRGRVVSEITLIGGSFSRRQQHPACRQRLVQGGIYHLDLVGAAR